MYYLQLMPCNLLLFCFLHQHSHLHFQCKFKLDCRPYEICQHLLFIYLQALECVHVCQRHEGGGSIINSRYVPGSPDYPRGQLNWCYTVCYVPALGPQCCVILQGSHHIEVVRESVLQLTEAKIKSLSAVLAAHSEFFCFFLPKKVPVMNPQQQEPQQVSHKKLSWSITVLLV